eukprot:1024208-Pleurochrysis_carterae.AAC.2
MPDRLQLWCREHGWPVNHLHRRTWQRKRVMKMTRRREDRRSVASVPAASCRASCRPCRLLTGPCLCEWDGPVTGTAPAAAMTRSRSCDLQLLNWGSELARGGDQTLGMGQTRIAHPSGRLGPGD